MNGKSLLDKRPAATKKINKITLWDPWGVFFIYLTYEIGISDYKGMNLGWMNLGWMNLGWMNLG